MTRSTHVEVAMHREPVEKSQVLARLDAAVTAIFTS
jgi:SH3-like domain-containing protein